VHAIQLTFNNVLSLPAFFAPGPRKLVFQPEDKNAHPPLEGTGQDIDHIWNWVETHVAQKRKGTPSSTCTICGQQVRKGLIMAGYFTAGGWYWSIHDRQHMRSVHENLRFPPGFPEAMLETYLANRDKKKPHR
jgi:hypothetical protein